MCSIAQVVLSEYCGLCSLAVVPMAGASKEAPFTDESPKGVCMEKINRGIIKEFRGSWQSGLGSLILESLDGGLVMVPCENGATVRALDACFGGVIDQAHGVNQEAIAGKEIYWSYDEYGCLLGGFTPVEEAEEKLLKAYAEQHS